MLEKLYSVLGDNFDPSQFSGLLSGEISTTSIILLSLVPLCIALFVRELLCWFYKVNGVIRRINRLETQLKRIADLLEKSVNTQTAVPASKITPPTVDPSRVDIELKRRDF